MLFSFTTFGQNQTKIDSKEILKLIEEGNKTLDTTQKFEKYRRAFFTSKIFGKDSIISLSTIKISDLKRKMGEPDSAKYYLMDGIKKISNNSEKTKLYLSLVSILRQEDKRDSALYYLEKSAYNSKYIEDVPLLSRINIVTGNFWFYEQNFKQAFRYYSKSDSILSQDSEYKVSTNRAQTLNYLGYAVRVSSGYQKAIQYYLDARKIYDNLEKDKVYHEINVSLAQAYINLEQYEEAMQLLNESIAYNKAKGFLNAYSYNLIVRGFGYVKMKDFEKAKQDYFEYYDVVQQMKSSILIARAKEYLGYFFYESGNLKESERYYKEALTYYEKTNKKKLQLDALESLIKVNKKGKQYDNLIQLYDTLLTRKKSYEEENIEIQTRELESKYQAEKKEQQIQLLQAKNETVEAQKTNQRNLLLGGIGITTFAGVFLFFLFRNRQKTNKMLRELDTAKSNFFANISHELRTPLALIATPIQEKLQKKNLSVKDRKEYDLILRNNNRLIDLVYQFLDLSKLESGNLKLKVTETPTRNF
ncbi:MAG: histidine kinase dimerization/phospho-acceptor domain-containing protein, partial [Bacteroidota bacterium]